MMINIKQRKKSKCTGEKISILFIVYFKQQKHNKILFQSIRFLKKTSL